MADTFESFGFDTGQSPRPPSAFPSFLGNARDVLRNQISNSPEALLRRLPPKLLEQFVKLAESGLFGEGGIEQLFRSLSRQGSLERNRLSRGLKQGSLGRRLGPRSGAIDNLIANKVFAPSFAGGEAAKRNLLVQNQQSKLGGLQGIGDLLGFFQNQFALDEDIEQRNQGPGVLDFVGPALQIGGAIFGGPAGAAAGSAVGSAIGGQRQRRSPLGGGGFNAPLFGGG